MSVEDILGIVIPLWVMFGPVIATGGALVLYDGEHKKLGARLVLLGLFLPVALPICTIYFLLLGLVYLFTTAFGE